MVNLTQFSDTMDFDVSVQSITFRAEERQRVITIPLVDDSTLENEESFTVELMVPSGSDQEGLIIANSSITIFILDNDSEQVTTNKHNCQPYCQCTFLQMCLWGLSRLTTLLLKEMEVSR